MRVVAGVFGWWQGEGVVVKIEYILGITTNKNRRRNETK
jgi:hypothetical protein